MRSFPSAACLGVRSGGSTPPSANSANQLSANTRARNPPGMKLGGFSMDSAVGGHLIPLTAQARATRGMLPSIAKGREARSRSLSLVRAASVNDMA